MPRGWWQWFGSPELDGLVARAFAGNPSLAAARARLRGAAATLRARRALRSPELSGIGSASYGNRGGGGVSGPGGGAGGQAGGGQAGGGQQGGGQAGGGTTDPNNPVDPNNPQNPGNPTDPNQPGGGNAGGANGDGAGTGASLGGDAFAVYTATATIRYDLDIAGRNTRLIEAAEAQTEARRQEVQAAYLSVIGNIVATALERATLLAQIETRETLIAAQNRRIELIRVQVAEGAVARVSLVAAQAEVATLRATLPPLRARYAAAGNALAGLVGEPPAGAGVPAIPLNGLKLPRTLPIAVPSRLVRTRPDILAAEALLRVASAQVGVAQADLYPNLTLDASFGVGGIDSALGSFFDVAGQLFAPLFDGGRRRAQRDVAVAAYEEALGNYRDRVIASFVQVADSIRALENDAVALAEQDLALRAARETFDLALFQEREGAVSSIDVLVVQQRYQDALYAYVDALARRFQDTAALFAALGPGPIEPDRLAAVTIGDPLAPTRAALKAGTPPEPVPPR